MKHSAKLSASMTLTQFENGYWYAAELKAFAKKIGIPQAVKLRKDELERAIKAFLRSGRTNARPRRSLSRPKERDVARGLHLDLRVVGYTSNAETKAFLEREARRLAPAFRRRSGSRYRLNRWREEQLAKGVHITYRALVIEYIRLNQPAVRYERIPHGRYINFMSDFLAAEPGGTREQAIEAWTKLKKMDAPKTYAAWVAVRSSKSPRSQPNR